MNQWEQLMQTAAGLTFVRHDIRAQLDRTGRYELPLPPEFPFAISLFHFSSQHFTSSVTWHERLELFLPLDGRVDMQMGDTTAQLEAGALLVVDNMKPHHVVDHAGFDTRVIVISFLPEFVYRPGASSHDYTFLVPFHAKVDGRHHVIRPQDGFADAVYQAVRRLLEAYSKMSGRFRETSCKAWFLVLLNELAQRFHDAPVKHAEFLRRQERVARFGPLLSRVHGHSDERITQAQAAKLTGMSIAQFTRQFRIATGMTFISYVTQTRLSGAARQLKNSRQTIAEIAQEAGFPDQSYFDRCFKKVYGQTPRDFRRGPIA